MHLRLDGTQSDGSLEGIGTSFLLQLVMVILQSYSFQRIYVETSFLANSDANQLHVEVASKGVSDVMEVVGFAHTVDRRCGAVVVQRWQAALMIV